MHSLLSSANVSNASIAASRGIINQIVESFRPIARVVRLRAVRTQEVSHLRGQVRVEETQVSSALIVERQVIQSQSVGKNIRTSNLKDHRRVAVGASTKSRIRLRLRLRRKGSIGQVRMSRRPQSATSVTPSTRSVLLQFRYTICQMISIIGAWWIQERQFQSVRHHFVQDFQQLRRVQTSLCQVRMVRKSVIMEYVP